MRNNVQNKAEELIIYPFGGNAKEALDSIRAQNAISEQWKILGFLDDDKKKLGQTFEGYPVLGGYELAQKFSHAKILAVPGNPDNYRERDKLIQKLGVSKDRFATIADPSARIASNALIGKNVLIMANVVIGTSAKVGDHCIILPNTVVSHDCIVHDFTIIGANVTLSGFCEVGTQCYIGSGTSVRERVQIGNSSLVGLGSNVLKNIPEGVIAVGNPAQILREAGQKK